MLDFILIGKSPLGAALRAALLAVLVTVLLSYVLSQRWQLFIVALVSVAVVLVAGYWISRRDDAWRRPPDV